MGKDVKGAYKYIAWNNIDKIREMFPEYTVSQVMYAVLRKVGIKCGEVYDLSCKDVYAATNKVIREEKED